jgi:two-component system sensor histidine kinase KdpD
VTRGQRLRIWASELLALAVVTLVMLPVRDHLDKAHTTLIFLLVVLTGAARGGRRLGFVLAGCSFLLFDILFLEPFNSFGANKPVDWLVLLAFLAVSAIASEMLHREQMRAEEARQRTVEVDRLAALGAEALNVVRADDALAAIASVIRETLKVQRCEIHTVPRTGAAADGEDLIAWAAETNRTAMRGGDGTTGLLEPGQPVLSAEADRNAVSALFIPLRVRDRTVGVLELADEHRIDLDPAQRRFLAALAYYAALAVERSRLAAEADRTEGLRAANRLKDALIASISHDLRTPLTTIKALAHALRNGGDERAATIEAEADRLNRLVADLLDLSQLQAGRVPLRLELNPVDDLLGALVQRVSGALGERQLVVTVEDGGALLVGRFDVRQSLRILVNLVENAHKYAPPGTPIDVRTWRDGAQLVMSVSDRGPGVPEPERDRIFEPFYRRPDTQPDVGGVGLGLAIARRLAEAQTGTLGYEPRPGGGSTFTLRLPAADVVAQDEELV